MMNSAKLEFLGAAGTVTGSRTLLTFNNHRILVDCGLFQGHKELRQRNWDPFPVDPQILDCIVLTHAHLDHSGYLPRLVRYGYRGPVYCSEGTADLLQILLLDSAKIQEEDADYANRTGHSHHRPALPLYSREDVEALIPLVKVIPEKDWFKLLPGVGVKLYRAGHIVGARTLMFSLDSGEQSQLICFSGDIGHDRMLTLRGPEAPPECDYLILESTYGNRDHDSRSPLDCLEKVILETTRRRGVLVIPAFAVGRAQEVIYMIRVLENAGRIPKIPVILDSPMSTKATDLFLRYTQEHQLGADFSPKDPSSFYPSLFKAVEGPDESFGACMASGPAIIVSAAGMLTGGRILHHLKSRLPHEENTVLFAGYQAEGTKGRFLQDHGKEYGTLRIHHEEVPVKAHIETMPALSAHGDFNDLYRWMLKLGRAPKKVFLNHGDPDALRAMKEKIVSHLGWNVEIAEDSKKLKLY